MMTIDRDLIASARGSHLVSAPARSGGDGRCRLHARSRRAFCVCVCVCVCVHPTPSLSSTITITHIYTLLEQPRAAPTEERAMSNYYGRASYWDDRYTK
jgi:hypothetical protein